MKGFTLFCVISVIISLIVLYPLGILWSLNTLFAFGLEYSLINWFAVVLLSSLLGTRNSISPNIKKNV